MRDIAIGIRSKHNCSPKKFYGVVGDTDGEGNGNSLQYSCLENLRDSRAWWAAVYGVAQSQTRLKRLSSSSSRGIRHGHRSNERIQEVQKVLSMF